MKVILETRTVAMLVLDEDESKWLRDMTQNYTGSYTTESADDKRIRAAFFDAASALCDAVAGSAEE